jgi:hypothetical protein
MTLALQIAYGTLVFWLLLLALRWLNVQPITEDATKRAAFAAVGLSGTFVGGAYPLVWAMSRNVVNWLEQGSTTFTFSGNLPVGVDEDDLLALAIVGLLLFIGQVVGEASRVVRVR